jgi:hypothetical protein
MQNYILWGERRINLNLIKEYKPLVIKNSYGIKLKYLDSAEEEISFGTNKEDRDKFLSFLDENFLKNSE